jgi:hypothetical protein
MSLPRCLPALAVLVAAAALATPAAATFGPPVPVSPLGSLAAQPAVDADGDAVFVWRRSDGADVRIQARTRSASGVLGPVLTLSARGQDAFEPQVAVDSDGDALIAWQRSDGTNHRIQARPLSATGALGLTQNLSPPGEHALHPRLAVDADGDAVAVWQLGDGASDPAATAGRARSAAGVLSPVQVLSSGGQALSPHVAISPSGDAVFTWIRNSPGHNYRVQTRARSAAGALSAVQTLSQDGQDAHLPRVAVDATGDAVLTWQRSDGTNQRVQTRARSAAGALSAVQTLSTAAGQGGFTLAPEVAVEPDGDAVFVWARHETFTRIQGRARTAGGVLGPIQNISGYGVNAGGSSVGMGADGRAVFTWIFANAPNIVAQARERTADGTLLAIQTLSDASTGAGDPELAVGPEGDAVAVWTRANRIEAAAGP